MKVYKSFKYELKLTPEQKDFFRQTIGICRFVWNNALELKKNLWENSKKKISWKKLDGRLPKLKKKYPWMTLAPSQSLQQVLKDLDKAFKRFFEGSGYPNFKNKYDDKSFRITQGQSLEGQLSKKIGLIKLPKIGVVRYIKTRNIEGEIKCSTISTRAGKWYISLCCVIDIDIKPKKNAPIVGIDRGVKKTAQCSDGKILERLLPSAKDVKKLKKLQRSK
jgi:putative transposase